MRDSRPHGASAKSADDKPAKSADDEPKYKRFKWTVMVLMDAGGAKDAKGFAPLLRMAQNDLAEMRKVPASPWLDLFAEVHDRHGARRHRFGAKALPEPLELSEGPVTGRTLSNFVSWAFGESQPESGDRSMLVLWGHSYQHAIGQLAKRDGSVSALDFGEFAVALGRVQKRRGPGKLVDIIGFDSCDLSALEVAVQLEPITDYLLASEMGVPLPGWPYDRILERIQDPMGRSMGPAELGSFAVRRFCEAYAANRAASLTLLRLSRAAHVAESVNALAERLAVVVAKSSGNKQLILDLFTRAQTDPGKPFVDLADLCLNLVRESNDRNLERLATTVGNLVLAPGGVTPGNSEEGIGRPFVLDHGRNAVRTAKLNGVSVYAPHVAGSDDEAASARRAYEKFKFAKPSKAHRSTWNQLVHNMAGVP